MGHHGVLDPRSLPSVGTENITKTAGDVGYGSLVHSRPPKAHISSNSLTSTPATSEPTSPKGLGP